MKLYTEEQMKQVISNFNTTMFVSADEILDELKLTPIELPIDEDIDKQSEIFNHVTNRDMFFSGAKWVINNIKQQDK